MRVCVRYTRENSRTVIAAGRLRGGGGSSTCTHTWQRKIARSLIHGKTRHCKEGKKAPTPTNQHPHAKKRKSKGISYGRQRKGPQTSQARKSTYGAAK